MDTLFTAMEDERKQQVAPLAVRMRPRTLEDVVGQQDAVGPGSWLRAAIEQDNVSSVILYGPAGTGKTSIAHVIAESTKATFVEVSAIGGTVSDLRREIDAAEKRLALNGSRTILFVDEIHRLYKLDPAARSAIVLLAGGDGRASLTTLELAAGMQQPGTRENPAVITKAQVESATPHRALPYDKNKDMHYDIISAFIKSMRGSDPDAALYWLARMIDGGEDPKYIARRMLIHASEDVGNADPQALLVAAAAFKSAEVIGYPECRINLAQAATYIALAPKSNACEAGIDAALAEVRNGPKRDVPDYLRDRHRPGSEHYGAYKYPHDYPAGWVDQRYLPEGLERGCFYHPSERGWESYRVDAAARDRAQAMHTAARDRAQAAHAAVGGNHGAGLPKGKPADVEANGVRSGRKKPGARDASEGEETGAR